MCIDEYFDQLKCSRGIPNELALFYCQYNNYNELCTQTTSV